MSAAPTYSAAPAYSTASAPAYAATGMTSQAPLNGGAYPANSYQQPTSYHPQQSNNATYYNSAAPQITNPYPFLNQAGRGAGRDGAFDPETEAQIAEWNSAYTPKDDAFKKSNATTGTNTPMAVRPTDVASPTGTGAGAAEVKKVTVVRSGGGKTWQDPSLLEWDPTHPRLFVGNLAGEVTDESLLKAFSKYSSVQKARVVRDKRTTKSKGYGFVAFSSTDDFFKAAKEMQGKYIGSHPVIVKRAVTEIKATTQMPKKQGKNGKKSGGPNAGGGGTTGAGVQKSSHHKKDKSGMKLLG